MVDGVLSRRGSQIPLAERQVQALERLASAEEERNRTIRADIAERHEAGSKHEFQVERMIAVAEQAERHRNVREQLDDGTRFVRTATITGIRGGHDDGNLILTIRLTNADPQARVALLDRVNVDFVTERGAFEARQGFGFVHRER